MFLLATAALLSCGEARDLARKVDSTTLTRTQYWDVISVIRESAPPRCVVPANPTLYRGQVRRRFVRPVVRPIYRRPRVRVNRWGSPTLIFRF